MTSARKFSAGVVLPLLLLVVLPGGAEGARFKKGDFVQVLDWRKQWRNGTVIDIPRRHQVVVEYEDSGRLRQDVFDAKAVRFIYEEGAIAPARQWSDASGSFKIMAAPLGIDGDKVRLRKEDMAEISVPVSKLSDVDQRFIERLKRDLGGVVGGIPTYPPLEYFRGAENFSSGFALPFDGTDARISLVPDPIPAYMRLKQGGVGFQKPDFWDELDSILPVGGPDSWLLTAVVNRKSGTDLPTRLVWASITKQKISKIQMLPMGEKILDYHPPTRRLLTYNSLDGDRNSGKIGLTLWEVMPTDDAVKPITRWDGSSEQALRTRPWGRIVDGRIVLQRRARQEYIAWDTEAKSVAYKVNQESFFAPVPVLSGGNKYVFLPEDTNVRIFDSQTGSIITALPAQRGSSGVAISEDGTRAAVLDRNNLTVWNLTNAAAEPTVYQAEAISTPFTAELAWVGDDQIMVYHDREMMLYSLEHRMVVWNYQFDHQAENQWDGRRMKTIINKHLVYGASIREGTKSGFAVGNVALPGPKVSEVVSTVERDRLEIVKPGTKVRLEVRCGDHSPQVYNNLVRKIQQNGWVLAQDDPEAVLYADMTRGQQQSTTYRLNSGSEQTVSFTPHISSLKLVAGDAIVWESGTRSGAPTLVLLQQGKSVQDEVNKWQTPQADFYSTVEIPARLLDPKYEKGLGVTDVTTRGLAPR